MLRKIILLKFCVGVGLVAAHFLPMEYAIGASIVSNMVWLWKL